MDLDLFTKTVHIPAPASRRTVLTTERNAETTKVKLCFIMPLVTLVEHPQSLIVIHTSRELMQ